MSAHPLYRFLVALGRSPTGLIGALVLVVMAASTLLAPWIFGSRAMAITGPGHVWPGTSAAFPLGTDMLGRDILRDLVYGGQKSLIVGLGTSTLTMVLGVIAGALAGYFGGLCDRVVMRIVVLLQTLPTLIFAMVMVTVLGANLLTVVTALSLMAWPTVVRLVRAEAMLLRNTDFVRAAIVIGMSPMMIVLRHVIPNGIGSTIAMLPILAANAILTESALSFLGLGDPNYVSWGGMVATGRDALRAAWFVAAAPGLTICLCVVALMFVGAALSKSMNASAVG